MRSNAKTQSGRARAGRPLVVLLATAAAFLLVPAAQALAAPPVIVNILGFEGGGGEVESVEFPIAPPIECDLPEGEPEFTPPTGTCESEAFEFGPGEYGVSLHGTPGPHSGIAFWEVSSGFAIVGCELTIEPGETCIVGSAGEPIEVTFATFCETEPCPPVEEPIDVTASKVGSGNGWLHSEGPEYQINCGLPCTTSKTAVFEDGEAVITASGAQFAGWEVCAGVNAEATEGGRTCTLKSTGAEAEGEAVAEYVENYALTVSKTGTGQGWVHSGAPEYTINCGTSCTDKTGFFEPGSEVTLTASGAEFTEWVSCPGVVEERKCTVEMTENLEAEVKYGS